jgi:hypothetical protein
VVQVENEELVYRTGTGHFAGFVSTSGILRHNLADPPTPRRWTRSSRCGPARRWPNPTAGRWRRLPRSVQPVRRLVTTLNKADRDALIRVVKDRAKLAEKDVAARARVLLAEVLDLMAAEFAANDALWSDQLLLAEEGVRQLNAQIRQRCSEVGIPADSHRM